MSSSYVCFHLPWSAFSYFQKQKSPKLSFKISPFTLPIFSCDTSKKPCENSHTAMQPSDCHIQDATCDVTRGFPSMRASGDTHLCWGLPPSGTPGWCSWLPCRRSGAAASHTWWWGSARRWDWRYSSWRTELRRKWKKGGGQRQISEVSFRPPMMMSKQKHYSWVQNKTLCTFHSVKKKRQTWPLSRCRRENFAKQPQAQTRRLPHVFLSSLHMTKKNPACLPFRLRPRAQMKGKRLSSRYSGCHSNTPGAAYSWVRLGDSQKGGF